jgi:hypothetical protein
LHRHAIANIEEADALLFGRVTYEMMAAAFRSPAEAVARAEWIEPFALTMDAAKKYVVSRTLERSIGTRSWCAGIWGRQCSSSNGSR